MACQHCCQDKRKEGVAEGIWTLLTEMEREKIIVRVGAE